MAEDKTKQLPQRFTKLLFFFEGDILPPTLWSGPGNGPGTSQNRNPWPFFFHGEMCSDEPGDTTHTWEIPLPHGIYFPCIRKSWPCVKWSSNAVFNCHDVCSCTWICWVKLVCLLIRGLRCENRSLIIEAKHIRMAKKKIKGMEIWWYPVMDHFIANL